MRSDDLVELVRDLASPDPRIRDDRAYPELAARIRSGLLTSEVLIELGDAMVERLGHRQIQARTFAPLILARIGATGVWHDPWTNALLDWWVNETDLRGHDEQLGWLHAVAHGADCVGQLGMHQLASTTMRTLRSLYVALDHPIAPYGAGSPRRVEAAEGLQSTVLKLLQQVTPALG